jgi:AbrB family looped-hinge helix DNA binding protein
MPKAQSATATVLDGGRIVVPAPIRAALGLKKGDRVSVVMDADGEVRLTTQAQVIKRLQALVKPYAIPGVSIVDELIADRRAEAAREDRGE